MKGMSTGEDLIEVWNKFKSEDEENLIVNWDFQDIKPRSEGFVYIQNLRSLYNKDVPGHWVACVREGSIMYYYDPFGCILPKRGVDKLKDVKFIYESLTHDQSFKGENSTSCGYYCIFFLLNFIRKFKKPAPYAVFSVEYGKFIDTDPNDKYIKVNIESMKTEIENNISCEK